MKRNLYDYAREQLSALLVLEGQKPYRATQLFKWIYQKNITDFSLMSDIAQNYREHLADNFCLTLPKIATMQKSADGTIKLLLELEDGAKIETVLMRYNYGNVACVSSQVGCNMGCKFCASGLLKKKRNLTPSEMTGQVLVLNQLLLLEEVPGRVSHVVVMGTGEPFDNYDHVMTFIQTINDPHALAIGARHITVSTCGIPDKIRLYGQSGLQINLAISLHAPNDEIRNQIMPINQAYPLKDLMAAVQDYGKNAGRRVTFEYILLSGINDQEEHADQLAKLIRPTFAYVNLIPYNEVDEHGFKRSNDRAVSKFFSRLKKRGVNVTIRREFGSDIDAACGQLRAKEDAKK
ncbi:MAG: 23S rRNA (adenine(2503)-C(2))-methyltransferase RlmN [Bacilli bacterium]|nr:23S rRNA (adenine(2503)-C(2))-methyltransferase RlmN [Bacilli bacterium]